VKQARSKVLSRLVRGSERPKGRMMALGMNWTYQHQYRSVDDELRAFEGRPGQRHPHPAVVEPGLAPGAVHLEAQPRPLMPPVDPVDSAFALHHEAFQPGWRGFHPCAGPPEPRLHHVRPTLFRAEHVAIAALVAEVRVVRPLLGLQGEGTRLPDLELPTPHHEVGDGPRGRALGRHLE